MVFSKEQIAISVLAYMLLKKKRQRRQYRCRNCSSCLTQNCNTCLNCIDRLNLNVRKRACLQRPPCQYLRPA